MRTITHAPRISKFILHLFVVLFLFVLVGLAGTGCTKGSIKNAEQKPHSVQLTWMPSASAVAGYNIYRGNVPGGPFIRQNTSLITTTHYEDVNVETGHTYFYNITAVDAKGVESKQSTEVSAQVPAR